MLDTMVKCPTVNSSTSLNINAVSGTVCKNHPKSVFVWIKRGSDVERDLMCAEPKFRFDLTKPTGYSYYKHPKESAVVLQAMLTGGDSIIAEIVRESDFFGEGGDA